MSLTKKKIIKWGLIGTALLFFLLALVIVLTSWANTVEFIWQSPVRLYKPLQIVERKILKPEILPEVEDNYIVLKVSHYDPALGGTNCANFVDGECISNMANGESWKENIGIAIACPKELDFGTKIKIEGRVWECMDRGGKITKDGEVYWVDMLYPYSLEDYGSIVIGEIL